MIKKFIIFIITNTVIIITVLIYLHLVLSSTNFYFSNLIDRYKLSGILWCALRNNVGHTIVNINELASLFNVKVKTVKKHLTNKLFFRSCNRVDKNLYSIYLVSIKKLREAQHIKLGVKWECSVTAIRDIVQEARLATTLGLQKRLRKAKIRNNKRYNNKAKVVRHVDLFNNDGTPLTNATGVIYLSQKNNKTTMFMASSIDISGASQDTIGKELNRHPHTIRRALGSANKIRMYRFSPEYYMWQQEAQFIDMEEGGNTRGSFYKYRNYTYKACPNVYYPSLDLLGYYK